MREIYASSWDFFTLTAEANRVLCQLAMFLTVFFHWMYKRVFCYSWLVCLLGFWWEIRRLSKSEIRFWMAPFVKYCILSEVCMTKTAPHSTVSPRMRCIKSIKGWFTRPQICWQDRVKLKLSNAKNSSWFVSKNLFSRPNILWSRTIMSL